MRLLTLGAGVLACAAAQAQLPQQAASELALVDGVLQPAQRLIVAAKGDALRWRIVSNLPGEVHVHAYRVSVALQPGQAAELAFKAHASGRFRVEWHGAGGVPGSHHAAPLATLEVRPR